MVLLHVARMTCTCLSSSNDGREWERIYQYTGDELVCIVIVIVIVDLPVLVVIYVTCPGMTYRKV